MLSIVTMADAAELTAANRRSAVLHAPFAYPCTDQAGFERWLRALDNGAGRALLARCGARGEIAGVLTFSQIFMGNFCSAYLGFYGIAGFTGRGIMTRALRMTVQYGFESLALHRLEANIQPANTSSLALVRRAGFRREGYSPRYLRVGGVWQDHERWAILRDDAQPGVA